MFGNLFGDVQQKQEDMKRQLATFLVEAEAGDGAVKVKANAARQILNVSFDKSKLDWNDQEQVEDLTLAAVNRALELATAKEQEEAQKMLQEMLPPGFGNLLG